ncbi:NAD(P)/FAD-dependent oxidoreductase [Hymenobacter sp. GOD-10R]|uniref:NAD(P)/FAD-dependent oxidoreductase n=1 Tax=Hymenobacter sp. GOD-10R TaxID=3093922 RepID=UPI002D777252|nr:FAD-dependent oxidoreductase [Hymenobacter sp. GOD-10R]WRQ29117.1 FAD-dependent oxidoreductase [Hymenobacter sp. GOD-10R]
MSNVVIVGGGIIGLFTAYYLEEAGFGVTVLDQGDLAQGCSTGNAGMIVPSHFVPLASPGMIGKGIKWMFSSKSPFYIHPRLDRRLVEWCLLFYRSATPKHVDRSIPYLKNLSLLSKSLYFDLAQQHPEAKLGLEEKGLLMLYKTAAIEHEEVEMAQLSNTVGIEANVLSRDEVRALEPDTNLDVRGAVHFTGDAHLDPAKLYSFLKNHLQARGVRLISQAEVLRFDHTGDTITHVITTQGDFACDDLVVCAGAWSGKVARQLGVRLPMLSGKGYSFMQTNQPAIRIPAILTEQKVAVTPFGGQVRFGGTMEITDTDVSINRKRVQGIFESIQRYYGDFTPVAPDPQTVWSGLRPCSPDGLPYIGPTAKWRNVLFGTGHSMMGISLAPGTGKLLAEQLRDQKTSLLMDAFSPDRYS